MRDLCGTRWRYAALAGFRDEACTATGRCAAARRRS